MTDSRLEHARRLKILVSTPSFLPIVGGAEMGIHEICTRLGRTHDVTVVAPPPRQEISHYYGAEDYQSLNYRVVRLMPFLNRARPTIVNRLLKRSSLPYFLQLGRMARRDGVDVVHFHFVRPHGLALVGLRRLLGVRTVLSLVGRTDVIALLRWPQRVYARLAIASADEVTSISSYCLGDETSDDSVIPYGVDTSAFGAERRSEPLRKVLGVGPDDVLLFTVQRLAPMKRVDVLLEVLARLVSEEPNVVLAIGGRGEEEARLKSLARDLGVERHVRFIGYIASADLPKYFASADLFVFHSMFETFGVVFAQAMASELPIVAARTSSVPAVVHPDNGVLVEPFDVPGFAAAIRRLSSDEALRTRIGKRNRARAVAEFDWDAIADAYDRVLRRAVGPS